MSSEAKSGFSGGIIKITAVAIILVLSLPLFLIAAYFFFLFWAHDYDPDFISIDGCMDSGGCWDYEAKMCRRLESNAQELCNQSRHQ